MAKHKTNTKKAFDVPRDSAYSADPISQICIMGASGVVPPEEAGDLDTEPGPDVQVNDHRRLARALSAGLIADVHRNGVRVPIIVGKFAGDDVMTVIAGKGRVRAARRSNRLRQAEGRPLIRVRAVVQRDLSPGEIVRTIIAENNARSEDDLADRIEKLKKFLHEGGSEADAAALFSVKKSTIQGWIDYDDHATKETKDAVRTGRLSAAAAGELARIKDPDKQREALAKMAVYGDGTPRQGARAVRELVRGPRPGLGRRQIASALERVAASPHVSSRNNSGYWAGVYHALILISGKEAQAEIPDDLREIVIGAQEGASKARKGT